MIYFTFKNYSISLFMGKKNVLLGIKNVIPPKMNAIQIVARTVERIFTSVTLQYFGIEYAGFKTYNKSPVTKRSTILLLCHLQNYVLFTFCQSVSWYYYYYNY